MTKDARHEIAEALVINAYIWVLIFAAIPVAVLFMWFEKNPHIGYPLVTLIATPIIVTGISWYLFSETPYKRKATIVGLIGGIALGATISSMVYFS